MKSISDKSYQFLANAYEKTIDDWFGDPDEQFTSWNHTEFIEWYNMMVDVGKDLCMDFWQVVGKYATDDEIDRVQKMLSEAGSGYHDVALNIKRAVKQLRDDLLLDRNVVSIGVDSPNYTKIVIYIEKETGEYPESYSGFKVETFKFGKIAPLGKIHDSV